MHNQKTIAKWLAVTLLLMVAIACYVALSAILKKDSPTPATATATEAQSGENASPSLDDSGKEHVPIYSTFPRQAEQIGKMSIQHVGGENDEHFVASHRIGENLLVIYRSLSQEYDQKESGLHIATFAGNYLLSVQKIAGENEEYLSSTISKTGLIVCTNTATNTVVRLVSSSGELKAETSFERFENAVFTLDTTTKSVCAFFLDDAVLRAMTIDDSLSVSRSAFVYSTQNANIKNVVNFKDYQLIFLQNDNAFEIVNFSSKNGFICKYRDINSTFVQILPDSIGSNFAFAALVSVSQNGTKSSRICTFDAQGNMLDTHTLQGVENGVLKQVDETIMLYSFDTAYQFCSHLELVATKPCSFDTSLFVKDVSLQNVDGTDMFVATDGTTFQIANDNFDVLFSAKGKNVCVDKDARGKTQIIYEGKNNDVLTYMVFGGFDIILAYV
ncbi:MAG: hypothetical protein J5815_03665 [Clostridia bacterium]|nr:hypothetical protein [Clostridia bacterium]